MSGPGMREIFSRLRKENVESEEKKLYREENKDLFKNNSIFEISIVEDVISDPEEYYNRPWFDNEQTYNNRPITLGQVFSGDVSITDSGDVLTSPIRNGIMLKFARRSQI